MNRRTVLKTVVAGTAALFGLPVLNAKLAAWNGYYKRKDGTLCREPIKSGDEWIERLWLAHSGGYGPEWANERLRGPSVTRKKYRDQRPLLWRPRSLQKDGTWKREPTRLLPIDNERFHDRLKETAEYHVEVVHGREITYLRAPVRNGSEFDGQFFWGAWDTTVPTRIQCIAGLCWTTLGLVRNCTRDGLPKYWLP